MDTSTTNGDTAPTEQPSTETNGEATANGGEQMDVDGKEGEKKDDAKGRCQCSSLCLR